MRPYVVKGHTRPITWIMYNREGDLLISCARDKDACLWYQEDGTRLGTFTGHDGVIYTADISWDSERLITASGDSTVRLWEMETGEELFQFRRKEPCRAVSFSTGERMAAFSCDPFMQAPATMQIVAIEEDMEDQEDEPITILEPPTKIYRLTWTDQNREIIAAHEDGFMRRWDVETGKLLYERKVHAETITDMRVCREAVYCITASLDKTAKLVDLQSLEVLKTYKAERPVNTADVSPLLDHIVLGGGQDAADVTTSAAQAGKFESRFYHKIYEELFGCVRGHFGPINSVAFHPSGRGFTSGGEDGYVRIHHFDDDYFTTKFF